MGHRCKNKQLQILLAEEENGDQVIELEILETDEPVLTKEAELSLNSVVGLSIPKTMKLRGQIARLEVVVMINCDVSHNFLSMDLVQKLGIPSVGLHCFGVLMGTGLSLKGEGVRP